MTAMDVVIVNHNTRKQLRSCLETLRNASRSKVIVVDNASDDGSPEMVRLAYPWATLVENGTNPGYGAGANHGIARCRAPYVLLLNSDTRVSPGALDALVGYLEDHPKVAVVGPRLTNLDGVRQASAYPFPTPLHAFLQESALHRLVRLVPIVREHYLRTWSHDRPRAVSWVLGAALAIRRNAFHRVGGFDETFFLYYEEVDLCYRLWAAGWEIHFAPVATIVHVGRASTDQQRADMLVQWYASLQHFYAHHYSRLQLVALNVLLQTTVTARFVRDFARLHLTANAGQRARLAEDLAGWRRLLPFLRHAL